MGWLSSIGSTVSDAFKNSAGSVVSSIGGYFTNKENRENQDYWNERQIELADTAHQRAVKDLEASGLNPILAANSAASTPSLSSYRMENPVSSFAQNSRELASALNGRTKAEVKQAEADATTAKAYADNAEDLARQELNEADARVVKAQNEADLSSYQKSAYVERLLNDELDEMARREAMSGVRSPEVKERVKGKEGLSRYKDLVDQYRNEIKSGKYKSSVGRAVFRDVLEGASSAGQVYRDLKGRRPGKVQAR